MDGTPRPTVTMRRGKSFHADDVIGLSVGVDVSVVVGYWRRGRSRSKLAIISFSCTLYYQGGKRSVVSVSCIVPLCVYDVRYCARSLLALVVVVSTIGTST